MAIQKDKYEIITKKPILAYFSDNIIEAKNKYKKYFELTKESKITDSIDLDIIISTTGIEYRSEKYLRIRDLEPDIVIKKILNIFSNIPQEAVRRKYSKKSSNIRAVIVYSMRILCDFTYKQICKSIGNISLSGVSYLCEKGYQLVNNNYTYRNIILRIIEN